MEFTVTYTFYISLTFTVELELLLKGDSQLVKKWNKGGGGGGGILRLKSI